jgi:hypothetical protein
MARASCKKGNTHEILSEMKHLGSTVDLEIHAKATVEVHL